MNPPFIESEKTSLLGHFPAQVGQFRRYSAQQRTTCRLSSFSSGCLNRISRADKTTLVGGGRQLVKSSVVFLRLRCACNRKTHGLCYLDSSLGWLLSSVFFLPRCCLLTASLVTGQLHVIYIYIYIV